MKKIIAKLVCLILVLVSIPSNVFAYTFYDINVSTSPEEGGKISLSENGERVFGDIQVDHGTNKTFYIIPETNYTIEDVKVNGNSVGSIIQYTFTNVVSPASISANFIRNQKTITITSIEHGQLSINGRGENNNTISVDEGSQVQIQVQPDNGYEIDEISIGNITYSSDEDIIDRNSFGREITVNENISISASFRLKKYRIEINVGPNGAVTPTNPSVEYGSNQTITITPSPGYMIRSLSVDGGSVNVDHVDENMQFQYTFNNVQSDHMMSVDFQEIISHQITTTVGANGKISPVNPSVTDGSNITFTITPDEGYMIDYLRVEGRPERVDSGEFTIYNVKHGMNLEVAFTEMILYEVTVPYHNNAQIEIKGTPNISIPLEGDTFTSNRGERISYFITPIHGKALSGIEVVREEFGEEIYEPAFFYYDEEEKKIRVDIETMSDYSLRLSFDSSTPDEVKKYSILSEEASTEEDIKTALRRELAMIGFVFLEENMNIKNVEEKYSDNNISYKKLLVDVSYPDSSSNYEIEVYVVSDVTNLIFTFKPYGGNSSSEETIILSGYSKFDNNAQVQAPEVPETGLEFYVFGPYAACIEASIDAEGIKGLGDFGKNHYIAESDFYRATFHVVNRSADDNNSVNWMPFTMVQENALVLMVEATSLDGPQNSLTWELDRSPDLSVGNATQEVFFGNDIVILSKPTGGGGNISSILATRSNSSGYLFTNNENGTVTVEFLSDFYDRAIVPLTITTKEGQEISRNLTIHRVGIDIQEYDGEDGNPNLMRATWHGTQNGNIIDLTGEDKYQISTSYHIPDYMSEKPYGLYVTMKYSNGRVERKIITQAMSNPSPGFIEVFDDQKKVFIYNDGTDGFANTVDYLIYSGENKAAAPVEVSVLVLKDAPMAGTNFGGVNFGSGTGVKWRKQ